MQKLHSAIALSLLALSTSSILGVKFKESGPESSVWKRGTNADGAACLKKRLKNMRLTIHQGGLPEVLTARRTRTVYTWDAHDRVPKNLQAILRQARQARAAGQALRTIKESRPAPRSQSITPTTDSNIIAEIGDVQLRRVPTPTLSRTPSPADQQ